MVFMMEIGERGDAEGNLEKWNWFAMCNLRYTENIQERRDVKESGKHIRRTLFFTASGTC